MIATEENTHRDQVGRTTDELAGQATQQMVLDDKRWWSIGKTGRTAIRKQESDEDRCWRKNCATFCDDAKDKV
jgi:hypothetical protein